MSPATNARQGGAQPLHLLRTKLYRPRPTGDLVHRTRLCELLDRYADSTVTLLCAPAGFGKTTLLTDWLEHSLYPSAWLSLDKGDGDLPVFLAYLVAAVRTLFPSACADTLRMLEAPVLPPPAILATLLINDLDCLADDCGDPSTPGLAGDTRFVLVLDDYHLVREPAVHTLLAELLRHPPRRMHLIICARQDPPFLDHKQRARSGFSEIRGGELRFTPGEVASFMQQALDDPLDEQALATLVDRTEGWGTGLRLTALTLKAGSDLRRPEQMADNRYTSDYLLAEVLSHVPAATLDFLLKTSILDRITGSLCDAVAPPADRAWDGRAYLEWLAAENVFTFSLDPQRTWYRYHHLFQKLLQDQLQRRFSQAEVAALHVRAAAWFAENGLIQEAIEHALAAGDELMAAHLVERNGREAVNRERWRQLEQWLGLLPRHLIDVRPGLLLLEAWIVENQWRFQDLPPYLDRIETMLRQGPEQDLLAESDDGRIAGEVDCLRSLACYYLLDWRRSLVCAERALAALPLECSTARGIAYMYSANGHVMAGNVRAGLDLLHEALKEDRFHGNSFPTWPYVGLGQLYWMSADPVNLFLAATQLLQVAQQRDLVEAVGWAHYFRGCARYQQNDLAGAEQEFVASVGQRYLTHAFPYSQGAFGLVMTLANLGQYDRACEVLDSAAAYGLEMNNSRVLADAEAVRACLAQRTGSIAEAHRWATSFDPNTPLVPLTTFSVPHMVRARVLVAEGSRVSLGAAAADLARLHRLAASTYNTRYLAEVLALEALIQDGHGKQAGAFDTLEEALRLAEPGNLIRIFADLGPRMRDLLGRNMARTGASEYRRRVLAAFGEGIAGQPAPARSAAAQPAYEWSQGDTDGPVEPLSRRELDVLLLLSERLTDKEIARELFVSPQTVKRHASNIYQKLDVGNRRDAVAKAAAYGLLPVSPADQRRSLASR